MEAQSRKAESESAVPLSLEALYEAYADMIYRLALVRTRNRSDAEDVLQDVFFRCLRRQPVFSDREHQKAWLLTAAINSSKSLLGSAFRRHSSGEEGLALLSVEPKEESGVYEALLSLPEKYRTAVHLYYYEGYAVKEIGEFMSCPESTVKSYLFRARGLLKERLKGEDADV